MGTKEKQILILTADAGLGHRSAAEAIQAALKAQFGNQCDANIINPLDSPESPALIQRLEEGYDDMVIENPGFYNFSYNALSAPLVSDVVRVVTAELMNEVMLKCIQENEPDIAVTTYPFFAGALAQAINQEKKDIPLVVVITDLTDVSSLWYSPKATMHFVATDQIRDQALENNIPTTRIRVTGLPVHPAIQQEKRSRSALRKELGWQSAIPTGLIVASERTQQMRLISSYLDQARINFQMAIVCGGDNELYEKFRQISWRKNVHIYGWVDNMPQLMKAADFLIAKAGGLIVSEALACGLPLIIPEALPGQEEGNVKFVVDNKAGAWAPGPAEVLTTTLSWLKGSHLTELQENAKKIGRPMAAFEIARGVWGLMGGK